MKSVLYVSSAPSPTEFSRIQAALRPGTHGVTYGMPEAGTKFHSLLQQGLSAQEGVVVDSLVGRSVSRAHHRGLFWPGAQESAGSARSIRHLPFINVPGIKQLMLSGGLAFDTMKWRREHARDAFTVIVDAAYITALPGVLAAAGGVPKIGIFADIYSYMADLEDGSDRNVPIVNSLRTLASQSYRKLDGFILLTAQMNDVVNPLGRPHLILEGIASPPPRAQDVQPETDGFVVTYAGALRREYGLSDLLRGFQALDCSAELHILGAGPDEEDVRNAELKDSRIRFLGRRTPREVAVLAAQSHVLINPRPAADFTKYSFPSKLMDYLASGTPVISTRLPGIPREYDRYLVYIDGEGPEAVRKSLLRVMAMSHQDRTALGSAARDYVLARKTAERQAERVVSFADAL